MTKHEIMRVLLIVGVLLMAIGIVLLGLIWATKKDPSIIRIRFEGQEMRTLNLTDTFTEKYQTVFDVYFKGLKKLKLRECLWSLLASVISTRLTVFSSL